MQDERNKKQEKVMKEREEKQKLEEARREY